MSCATSTMWPSATIRSSGPTCSASPCRRFTPQFPYHADWGQVHYLRSGRFAAFGDPVGRLRGVCRAVPQTVLRIGYVGIHGTNDDETYPIAQTTPTYICTPPRASRCRPAPTPECCRSLTTSTRTIDRIQRVRHRAGTPQDRLLVDERDPARSGTPLPSGLPIPDPVQPVLGCRQWRA